MGYTWNNYSETSIENIPLHGLTNKNRVKAKTTAVVLIRTIESNLVHRLSKRIPKDS